VIAPRAEVQLFPAMYEAANDNFMTSEGPTLRGRIVVYTCVIAPLVFLGRGLSRHVATVGSPQTQAQQRAFAARTNISVRRLNLDYSGS